MGGEDGQPALLYIVPLTLLPTLFLAWRRKEFLLMWRGQVSVGVIRRSTAFRHWRFRNRR